jgi:ketosteroid isomerase-like protein
MRPAPALIFAVTVVLSGAAASPAPTTGEGEIAAFQRELIAALKQGDRPALERLIAEGFTFVHSTGGLDTRREYIENIVSAAAANRAADIERLDQQVQVFDGHTAVTTSRAILRGRGEDILLRSTHVYVKRGDRWQWAGGQSTKLPTRPKALATITTAVRDSYAGRYEINPGRVLTVSAQGETLKVVLPGFREAELIPRTETEFAWFNPELNVESQIVFVRDDAGNVTHAAYRRDGKEVWRGAKLK